MDHDTMKKIGREIGILMSISVSLTLSLVGTLSSGHFSFRSFLLSFALSFAISLVISFLVPIKPLCDRIEQRHGVRSGSFRAKLLESAVSDLLYTPIITTVLTAVAYRQAVSHGAQVSFLPMLLRSLLISLAVGFVLILILQPFFIQRVLKRRGKHDDILLQ